MTEAFRAGCGKDLSDGRIQPGSSRKFRLKHAPRTVGGQTFDRHALQESDDNSAENNDHQQCRDQRGGLVPFLPHYLCPMLIRVVRVCMARLMSGEFVSVQCVGFSS